jgi:hypothetical protein
MIGLGISSAAVFGVSLDAPNLVQLGLVTESFAALAGIFLHAFAELGNPWPMRLFLTVGRRPYSPEELLDILRKAPAADMRDPSRPS